jgi:L-ascorbate metabolism protein UlaG (beta-lactamase superfamily)
MEIRFHGHSCFELSDGEARLLVDPFLKPNNPAAVASAEDVDATHIAVSHGHVDHIADAVPVATRTGAECVAIVEIANWLGEQGVAKVHDPNLGGTVRFDWGWVKLVPAWHTSTIAGSAEAPYSPTPGTVTGTPAGLVISIGGVTVYHAGDTCLFGDMKLIAERNPIDVALLPIGGHYTMDRHDAVVAAGLIGAGTVIPMHYDTFGPIETDSEAFKSEVESKTSSSVVILKPGDTHAI